MLEGRLEGSLGSIVEWYTEGVSMSRVWIKIWCEESLSGTIRFDFTPAQRSVWYDLLALAGKSRKDGYITPGSGNYPLFWIAHYLHIRIDLLKDTLKKCIATNRIAETPDGLKVINWNRYQSEYERQKPYRKPIENQTEQTF